MRVGSKSPEDSVDAGKRAVLECWRPKQSSGSTPRQVASLGMHRERTGVEYRSVAGNSPSRYVLYTSAWVRIGPQLFHAAKAGLLGDLRAKVIRGLEPFFLALSMPTMGSLMSKQCLSIAATILPNCIGERWGEGERTHVCTASEALRLLVCIIF